jgi:hypothetical protein
MAFDGRLPNPRGRLAVAELGGGTELSCDRDSMCCHYVLIDLENVHCDFPPQLVKEQLKVLVFVGAKQSKVPLQMATVLQPLGDQVEYIKISGTGPNALDFHIAFYIGRISNSEPSASFSILSDDKGYDPLIQHLRSQDITANRIASSNGTESTNASSGASSKSDIDSSLSFLKKRGKSKPTSIKTLHNSLAFHFNQKLSPHGIQLLVNQLAKAGHVIRSGKQVSYRLPDDHGGTTS